MTDIAPCLGTALPASELARKDTPFARSILRGEWSQTGIEAVLARHPRVGLVPGMDSPEWQRVAANPRAQELFASLRAKALEECGVEMPALTDELYASFHRTGVRLTFETVYIERRYQLGRAAMSLLLSGRDDPWRERLVESVTAKFRDIAEESSWALPAHVNWDNDDASGKDPMQIDLLCADTAHLAAEVLDLFPGVIPAALREQVRERLYNQVFANYLNRDFHWMEVTHNWNSVCHQGVIGAALSQVEDDEMLAAMLRRMHEKLPLFLEGFGADGGCSEGPSYWDYGFGKFATLNEQLETRTGGELSLFADDAHVRAIACYGPRMALGNGYLVNFADSEAAGGLDPALLAYLGERLGDSENKAASAEQYRWLMTEGLSVDQKKIDVYFLSRWLRRLPTELPVVDTLAADSYFPDLEVVVARDRDAQGRLWEFAAKGGHNDEHHNHNDCGSFLLNVGGERLIVELGAPEYVRDYFGPRRYESLAARSSGHSVPLINGCEQVEGAQYRSRVLSCEMKPSSVGFSLDLTACYPPEAGCRKLIRTFFWDKTAKTIDVVDDFELVEPGHFISTIIAGFPAAIRDGAAEITGEKASVIVACELPSISITDEAISHRNRVGQEQASYCLCFQSEAKVAAGSLRLRISA